MNDNTNKPLSFIEALIQAAGRPAHEQLLEMKAFEPLSVTGQARFKEFLETMSNTDPSNVDTIFVTVLTKDSDKPQECEDCQTTHYPLDQHVLLLGDPTIAKAAIMRAMAYVERSVNEGTAERDAPISAGPDTKQ